MSDAIAERPVLTDREALRKAIYRLVSIGVDAETVADALLNAGWTHPHFTPVWTVATAEELPVHQMYESGQVAMAVTDRNGQPWVLWESERGDMMGRSYLTDDEQYACEPVQNLAWPLTVLTAQPAPHVVETVEDGVKPDPSGPIVLSEQIDDASPLNLERRWVPLARRIWDRLTRTPSEPTDEEVDQVAEAIAGADGIARSAGLTWERDVAIRDEWRDMARAALRADRRLDR